MCVAPCKLDDGTEVACRYCWQCRRNRVNDLVGRSIAESKFSSETYAVTLTYAKDAGVNAVTLVYKDVQDFLKRLRKRYKVRYIVAGEYGTKKGRAHWHIILFFKGKAPQVKQDVRVDWKYWPHGFSYFQKPDWKGFQYVLKYVLKDSDRASADSHLAMSKKPPLGHEYFQELAKTHVDQAVIPRTFKYKIGGIRKDNGEEKVFMMQGVTRDNFMNAVKEGWKQKYGKEPFSEFFEEWDEANYSNQAQPIGYKEINGINMPVWSQEDEERLMKRLHHKDVMYVQPWTQFKGQNDDAEWVELDFEGMPLVMYDDGTEVWFYQEDGQAWREERKEVVDQIRRRSVEKTRRKFSDASRDASNEMYNLRKEKAWKPGRSPMTTR